MAYYNHTLEIYSDDVIIYTARWISSKKNVKKDFEPNCQQNESLGIDRAVYTRKKGGKKITVDIEFDVQNCHYPFPYSIESGVVRYNGKNYVKGNKGLYTAFVVVGYNAEYNILRKVSWVRRMACGVCGDNTDTMVHTKEGVYCEAHFPE